MTKTQYLLFVFLAAFCVLLCNVASARGAEGSSEARDLHDQLHVLGGFAAGTGGYGIWKAIVRKEDRGAAVVFGLLTGALACVTKEMSDVERSSFSSRDLGYCGLGVGASTLTIWAFDF